jgi:tRNA-specific 2-thiouridylase
METRNNTTVVAAMSGGVDSSVAAALLVEQGYNVIGVTMKTYEFDDVGGNVENEASCCGLGAMNDARMVAAQLGIPHYVVDFRKAFGREVISNFVDEYFNGRTPNPCVICNREIKWGELIRKAEALGAHYIATGHYAQVHFDSIRGRCVVSQARDLKKDQTYALWALSQAALSKTIFPLGNLLKPETRRIAERLKLRTANKQESYEICFVPDNNYGRFLKEERPERNDELNHGNIVWNGDVVGHHGGYPFYTIGQRKGIGSYGERVYVTNIDHKTNTIHVGREADLFQRELVASKLNLVSRETWDGPMRIEAKVRYKDEASPATLYAEGSSSVRVIFDEPKRAITPGQSVVFYRGSELVGGAVIDLVVSEKR